MSKELKQYLEDLSSQSFDQIYNNGFTYFHHVLVPRLLEAGKDKSINRSILAAGWLIAGKISFKNYAPEKALQFAKKARTADAEYAMVYGFMAEIYKSMGAWMDALDAIDKAIDIDVDDLQFTRNKLAIQDAMNYGEEPLFVTGDKKWKLTELLANEQFETVVNQVFETKMNDVEMLAIMARAFGALGHNANCLQTWRKIHLIDDEFSPSACDYFYASPDIHHDL